MFLPILILSQLLLPILSTTAASNVTLPATISLWLPWLPNAAQQPLYASVISSQPNATTYAYGCHTSAIPPTQENPHPPEPVCIVHDPLPETVTVGPSTVIMSRSAGGNFEQWNCNLTGQTTGTCQEHSTWTHITLAGHTQGAGHEEAVSVFPANSIVFRQVTVTAGNLTAASTASASTAVATATASTTGSSNSMTGTTTPARILAATPGHESSTTAQPATATKNVATAAQVGTQGSWLAVGGGIVGLMVVVA